MFASNVRAGVGLAVTAIGSAGLMLALACQHGDRAPEPRLAHGASRCLEAPAGETLAKRRVIETQQRLAKSAADTSAWVAVGHAWVRAARTDAEPALYRHAEACAEQALTRSAEDAAALGLRALVLLNEHRFARARDLMRSALARDDADAMAWGLLSDAQLELGELDAAIDSAQRMLDLKPNLPSYGRAAHLRWLQGDVEAAKQVYQQAIRAGFQQADPEPRAWMISQAALLFWNQGDYAGADAGFDLALRQVPQYPAALEGKGRVALARGDYAAAIGWLERAASRGGLSETRWLLGDARWLSGQRAAAQREYAIVVRDGRNHDPRTLAAFYATKNRDIAEAVKLARAEMSQRHDLYTKDVLAWALYRAGELDEAKQLGSEILATGTQDARLLFHAGTIRAASGDLAAGESLIGEALKINPRFDPLLLAQRQEPSREQAL